MTTHAPNYFHRRGVRPSGQTETIDRDDEPKRRDPSCAEREHAPFLDALSGRDPHRVARMRSGYFGLEYAR